MQFFQKDNRFSMITPVVLTLKTFSKFSPSFSSFFYYFSPQYTKQCLGSQTLFRVNPSTLFCYLLSYKLYMEEGPSPILQQSYREKQKKQDHPIQPQESSPFKLSLQSQKKFGKLLLKDSDELLEQNRQVRLKLKELSKRLDQELQKAAEQHLRQQNQRINPSISEESQAQELQNAKKIIDRLQRTVKDYENKEGYQVSLKRVMDLEEIVRKKDQQIQELKSQIKIQRRIFKEKQRQIQQLIANASQESNPTEGLQTINKMRKKLQKLVHECQVLRKKEQEKHNKLLTAQRRIAELEAKSHSLQEEMEKTAQQRELKELKNKYHEAVQRLQRQNIQIAKINQQLAQQSKQKANTRKQKHVQREKEVESEKKHQKQRQKTGDKQFTEPRRNYSVSLDALPKSKVHFNDFQEVQKGWK